MRPSAPKAPSSNLRYYLQEISEAIAYELALPGFSLVLISLIYAAMHGLDIQIIAALKPSAKRE